jgi:tetratricopeptide (TPR) repeat protein
LDESDASDIAEQIGRRLVEFQEEWSDDLTNTLSLLQRIFERCKGATWAFDRLKLAYNASGRWSELFTLYDQAIERSSNNEERCELLREAAMAAKDFANDAERAIDYFSRLDGFHPNDARVEAALERLYERKELIRPLIELLSRQMKRTSDALLQFPFAVRITSYWLDIGEAVPAFELLEGLLKEFSDTNEVVELFERLVALPAARDSFAPPATMTKKEKKEKARALTIRDRSALRLRQYYESVGRIVDVVRMLEIEVDLALDKSDRIARLRRIIEVRLSQLDDVAGAFENAVTLTNLAPEDAEIRALLDELAERHGVRDRQASLLVEIAERHVGKPLRVLLLREAADITCHQLLHTGRAIELYADVLNNAGGDKENARLAARELDRLLAQAQRPIERCDVLERLADLESEAIVRRRALGEAAIVALDELRDAERAVRCWRLRLDDNPDDSVARDGLVLALEHTDRDEDLIVALTERAERASDAQAARSDRVRVAQIWQTRLGSPQKSITAWQTVRELHGRDDESYEALVSLFTSTERWSDLALLVKGEADLASDLLRSKQLRQTLGAIYADRLGEVALALRAYIEAEDWDRAIAVTASVRRQPDLALEIGRELLNRAVLQWTSSAGNSETPEANATAWVIGELTSTLRQAGAHGDIVDLLLHAASLPFATIERRTYKRDAAYVCSDYLEDRDRAISLYQEIIDENAADEIAANCISPLAALLEQSERSGELVDLWEVQAGVRLAGSDNSGAAVLYARAAELSESRLKDIDRALSNYAKAADLGLDAALESLARLYDVRSQFDKSAAVLERFCAAANRETLGERSLWLAQAYVNCGRPDSARRCLEHASNNARDLGSVRARLAVLYEEAGLWLELAELLTLEATRSADARERLQLLVKAARVHRDKRSDPSAAVPLLEQAGQIDQDDVDLRLELAEALSKADSHAQAANVLREQINRYGARRPKERAMVHHALARELLALGERNEALEELRSASRIDPARAEVLQLTAKLSMDLGDLDAAEKTFRALLLVLGRGASTSSLSRVEALLDLSEIALRRDDGVRASEYVESAFEIALETDQEAEAFERAARARGRNDWLLRVLEERLSRATVPTTAAHALFDFARLHSETLGDLSQVAPRIAERAQQIHKQLEKTAVNDDAAWSALSRVYDLLGDESAQARILELRVQAWLDGVVPIDDPKPVLRMGTLKLKSATKRSEGLRLLERAHEAGATTQQLEDIIGPALDADPSWVEAIDLLEKIARVDGNSQLLSRSLLHRLNTPDATLSQYLETVDLLRSSEDTGALSQILEAAVNGLLGVKFDQSTLASARLELADVVLGRGELERAFDLREVAAAEGLPESTRTQVLLQTASMAADGQPPRYPERAVRLYQILLADYPSERAYWEPLLELLRKMGDTRQLVAVIESTVPAVSNQDDRSRLRLEQARLLVDSGDTGSAADELRELLTEDPAQTEAAILLAGILERSGRHDELVQLLKVQFENAQAANDTQVCVDLLGRIASLSETRGRIDEALEALERALAFQNNNREILERIVELSERLGDTDRAAGALQLLQGGETDPQARLSLLDKLYALHIRATDTQAAFQIAKDAFECDPTESNWQKRLFDYLEESGDLSSLAQYLSRASVASPNDINLTLRLVEVNRKSGNFAQALEVLDGVLASGVESTSLSCERGRLLLELGRYDEALVELELVDDTTAASAEMLLTAIQAATPRDDSDRSRQLGLRQVSLLARVGRDDEMHQVLADLNQRFPGDLAVLELWAQWLSTHGAPDEALGALERLVTSVPDPDVARALEAYLQLCDTSGVSKPALAALERGVHLHPERHDWRQRLLELYRLAGANRQLAEQLLIQAAFEADPSVKQGVLLQAAELLLGPEGDLTAAHEALEQAHAIAPDSLEGVILLARLHNAEGNRAEAIGLLQATTQSNRGRRSKILAGVYRELSQIMLEDGLKGEALDALLRAFEMDSKNGQLAMQTGRLAMEVENFDVALRVFARIAMMKPVDDDTTGEAISHADRADANYCLAYLSYNQGDARKAKILALKALSDNSEHDEARRLVEQLG